MNITKKLYNFWFKIDDKIRFLFIGAINTAISYIIFVILILIIGKTHYQICITGQWVISSFFSYFNQKVFVFNTKGNYIKEYLKCLSTWSVSYILNIILFEIIIRFFVKNVFIVQFIVLIIVSIVTYILLKYFAFRNNHNIKNKQKNFSK